MLGKPFARVPQQGGCVVVGQRERAFGAQGDELDALDARPSHVAQGSRQAVLRLAGDPHGHLHADRAHAGALQEGVRLSHLGFRVGPTERFGFARIGREVAEVGPWIAERA